MKQVDHRRHCAAPIPNPATSARDDLVNPAVRLRSEDPNVKLPGHALPRREAWISGPDFQEGCGCTNEPPKMAGKGRFPMLVSSGGSRWANETSGLRLARAERPRWARLTGLESAQRGDWAPRTIMYTQVGSFYSVLRGTKAEAGESRGETPRLSLEERYGTEGSFFCRRWSRRRSRWFRDRLLLGSDVAKSESKGRLRSGIR